MNALALRPARPDDMAAITAIYRPAVLTGTASFEIEPPAESEMLARYRAIVEAGYPYLVATNGARILGYGYLNAYRPRAAYRFTVEDSIYIAPDAQRQGVGRLLLDALVGAAVARGDRLMIAVIGDSAQAGSLALHARAGFAHAGLLPGIGYKFDRWLDSVLMQRQLRPSHTAPPRRVTVARETPDQPTVLAFLAASDAYAQSLYPPESNHLLAIAELLTPSVIFFVARLDGVAVGCGAYVTADDGSVEIKRMWVDPVARGMGAGTRILAQLEASARAGGAMVARLETGIHNTQALGLYTSAGFIAIPPFGSYQPDPLSVFMAKGL